MDTILRTPDLRRSLSDYIGVLGFRCLQHVPGVLAIVAHGPLQLQLWGCAAVPGRWESPDPLTSGFVPSQHSVVVSHIHGLHASLRRALLQRASAGAAAAGMQLARRLPADAPQLQPWGAWEFSLHDIDGHILHCVDWSPRCPLADRPRSQTQPGRSGPGVDRMGGA